jgi:hypothetical protein
MSMEIHVFSDRPLASMADWQQALVGEGFDLRLSAARPLEALGGFLPVQWGDKQTGFECYHDDAGELMVAYVGAGFGHPWQYALSLRWGADLAACVTAYMAATAYAKATGGVVFDPEDGKILSPHEAQETIREMERYLPTIEAELSRIQDRSNEPDS